MRDKAGSVALRVCVAVRRNVGAALRVPVALRGKAEAAALRVHVAVRGGNDGAGLRVREHRGKAGGAEAALLVHVVLLLHGTAGAEAALRVRDHQHDMWLAVEGLCGKTCIQFPRRGRAFYSKNSDKFWGSPCASELVSSASIPRKTFCPKLYIQSS